MSKIFFVFVPLLISLLSFEGRGNDIPSIGLQRDAVLVDMSIVELRELVGDIEDDEQLDYLDYDCRLDIQPSHGEYYSNTVAFTRQHQASYASIRAPPAS